MLSLLLNGGLLNMNYKVEYEKWMIEQKLDINLKEEMLEVAGMSEQEVEDRFYKKLDFGTAGIRGVLGAGTNRMNVHTVAEVTEGLARKILADGKATQGVVIGYDVRHMSKEFAELATAILSNKGITVHLFDDVIPTPVLSYALRELKAISGIMITASHNPKEYNGYKVYWEDGTQISDEIVKEINYHKSTVEDIFGIEYIDIEEGLKSGIVKYVDKYLIEKYKDGVLSLSINDNVNKDISVVYSPLNGVGRVLVEDILKERGFNNVHIVKEQEYPDQNFTTVEYPNPEEIEAFTYAIREGKVHGADLLIATDPDADRVGAMVKHDGEYSYLSGNKLGALMVNYMLSNLSKQGKITCDSTVVKTIVTDNLVDDIAKEYGATVFDVHVGFKNIYTLVNDWESSGYVDYIIGYEESLGFGIGSELARDKDAVSASMMIVEMVAYYNDKGKTLVDVLNEIQNKHGFHSERLESITMPGKDGQTKMENLVKNFRINPIRELNGNVLVKELDYLNHETGLDKMNVLKYVYDDGTWFALRPSGTEPKLKVYVYTVAETEDLAESKMKNVIRIIKKELLI